MIIRACALVLAGGIAAQHSRLPWEETQSYLLFVTALVLLSAIRWRCAAICITAFIVGYSYFMFSANDTVSSRLAVRYAGDSMVTTVRIENLPNHTAKASTFRVTPLDDTRIPKRTLVSWYQPPQRPNVGEIWQFELRLKRPRGFRSPGAFDREAWLFRERIHATGYVVSGKRNAKISEGAASFRDRFRHAYLQRLARAASGDPAVGIVAAITVGIRHDISPEQWRSFAISGTSHLMAISGLHVGLAASLAVFMTITALGICGYSRNSVDIAAIVATICAGSYSYLTGFGVPAMRASIMFALLALALLARRELPVFRVLLLAAVAVYVLAPAAILSPGFALSFIAVLLLLGLARQRSFESTATTPIGRAFGRLRSIISMQVLLLLGLLPLTSGWFHRVPVLAPVANILLVPVFSFFVIPVALLGLVLSTVSSALFDVSTLLVLWVIRQSQVVSGWLADLPNADVSVAGIDSRAAVLCVLVMLWALLPRQWPGRWISPIAAAAIVLSVPERPAKGCFNAHVLDVGQGSAHVIMTRSKVLLFDTGVAYRNGGSAADQIILPFLRHLKVGKIDWLVVSHADLDHSGGVPSLIAALPVDHVFTGEPIPHLPSTSAPCFDGRSWQVDGVQFEFIYPLAGQRLAGNNASCVLKVSTGGYSVILTGDLERSGERQLLESHGDIATDVVVVPHHGSATSSSEQLVQAMRPQLAIASTGFANRWGFPRQEVVARWQQIGARFLHTGRSGTISFSLCRERGLHRVSEYRYEQWRFWRE